MQKANYFGIRDIRVEQVPDPDCLASVKYQGTVVVQGIFTERALIHMLGFVSRETTMIGTNSIHPPLALQWLESGKIRPESIVTDIIPLADIAGRGFEVLAGVSKTAIKSWSNSEENRH